MAIGIDHYHIRQNALNRFISGYGDWNEDHSQFLSKDIYVDENDVLRCSPDFDISKNFGQIYTLLNNYDNLRDIYHEKMRYYKGDHGNIRTRTYNDPTGANANDDRNRVVVNMPKNLVNTFTGYTNGIAPKINYSDKPSADGEPDAGSKAVNDDLAVLFSRSRFNDVMFEWSKQASIHGRSYCLAYLNSRGQLKLTFKSPENAFVVYSNSNDSDPVFAVDFNRVQGAYYGTVHTTDFDYQFNNGDVKKAQSSVGFENSVIGHQGRVSNPFKMIPLIEMAQNDEREGVFDDVISLIDSMDNTMSAKIDDVDYFRAAILYIAGVAELTPEQKETIRKWHIFQIPDTVMMNENATQKFDVHYLDKPDGDNVQENAIKHLTHQVYDTAQVTNMNDPDFANSTASGVSLDKKMQPMQMMAAIKFRKMEAAVQDLLFLIYAYNNGEARSYDKADEMVRDTTIQFTPNVPHDTLQESQIVKNLNGIVSLDQLLSYLSSVKSIPDEMARIKKQQAANQTKFANTPSGDGPVGPENESDSQGDDDSEDEGDDS
ncbi:phage portal protein [Levilactobacillus brevis]